MPDVDSAQSIVDNIASGGPPPPTGDSDFDAKMQIGTQAAMGKLQPLPKSQQSSGSLMDNGQSIPVKDAPGFWEDTGKTLVGSTIPRTAAAIPMMVGNTGNLIASIGKKPWEYAASKIDPELSSYNDKSATPFYSSEDALQWAGDKTGIHPYDPKYGPNQFMDTALQFAGGNRALGGSAINGLISGITSEGVGHEAHKYLPEFETAARIMGAVAGGGGAEAVKAAGGKYIQPFTEAGRSDMAATKLFGQAENPQKAGRALTAPLTPEQTPVSQLTTAEATQDPGLARYQQQLAKQNPQAFDERAAEQDQARTAAIQSVAPQGDPSRVGTFFNQIRDQIAQDGAATSKQQQAAASTQAIGTARPAEELGSQMRGKLSSALKASDAQESKLWDAIKPYYPAKINGQDVVSASKSILESIDPKSGDELLPAEHKLLTGIGQWNGTETFETLRKLSGNIRAAQREVRMQYGDASPPMRRLQQLQAGVDASLENNINGIGAQEQQAVAAGKMSQEATMHAKLAQEAQNWYNTKNEQSLTSGSNRGIGAGRNAGGGSSRVPDLYGTKGQPGMRPGDAQGSAGVQGPALDETVEAKYQAAKDFTKDQRQTYGQGSVGDTLAPGSGGERFKLQAGQVPSQFFHSGPAAAEDIRGYLKAGGAAEDLHDAAMSSMEKDGIFQPDGTVNGNKFASWTRRHGEAINAVPGLSDKIKTAQSAWAAHADALANREAALDTLQKSKASLFLDQSSGGKGLDPTVAAGKIFSSGNSAGAMNELVGMAKADPEALKGLQKAVGDYIVTKIRGSLPGDEAGIDLKDPKLLRQFLDTHREALKTLYGGQGYNNLVRVANDTMRSDAVAEMGKSLAKKPENPTVMDWVKEQAKNHRTLSDIGGYEALKKIVPAAIKNPLLAAPMLVGGIGMALRAAKISTVNDLVLKAALHPEVAAELFKTYSAKEPPQPVLRRASMALLRTIPPTTNQQPKDQK